MGKKNNNNKIDLLLPVKFGKKRKENTHTHSGKKCLLFQNQAHQEQKQFLGASFLQECCGTISKPFFPQESQ
jgi:hypothetical protein